MSELLSGQILEQVRSMPAAEQKRVLEFARALALSASRGVPGKELLRFAGTIPLEDLQQMNTAIAEGCERVDANEW